MGEKIKTISQGRILDTDFEIELNQAPSKFHDQQVHIQSDKIRLEMDKAEFVAYGLSILIAEKNLKNLKGIK
jgi:hypothetical protein